MARALDFYGHALGFRAVVAMGDPPEHAIVARDGAELTFARADHPSVPSIAACYINVTGVAELYEHCRGEGVEIVTELTDRPWGMRDFVIRDPDGHLIAVGERVRNSG